MDDNDIFLSTHGKNLIFYTIEGNWDKKIQEIYRLISLFPERKSLLYSMLASHYMLNDDSEDRYIKAIETYKKIIALEDAKDDHVRLALLNLASAYKAINKPEKALKCIDQWISKYSYIFIKNPKFKKKILADYKEILNIKNK